MTINTEQINILTDVLLKEVGELNKINNEYGRFLNNKFNVRLAATKSLYSDLLYLQEEIEKDLSYMVKYPETNQALNKIILIQK